MIRWLTAFLLIVALVRQAAPARAQQDDPLLLGDASSAISREHVATAVDDDRATTMGAEGVGQPVSEQGFLLSISPGPEQPKGQPVQYVIALRRRAERSDAARGAARAQVISALLFWASPDGQSGFLPLRRVEGEQWASPASVRNPQGILQLRLEVLLAAASGSIEQVIENEYSLEPSQLRLRQVAGRRLGGAAPTKKAASDAAPDAAMTLAKGAPQETPLAAGPSRGAVLVFLFMLNVLGLGGLLTALFVAHRLPASARARMGWPLRALRARLPWSRPGKALSALIDAGVLDREAGHGAAPPALNDAVAPPTPDNAVASPAATPAATDAPTPTAQKAEPAAPASQAPAEPPASPSPPAAVAPEATPETAPTEPSAAAPQAAPTEPPANPPANPPAAEEPQAPIAATVSQAPAVAPTAQPQPAPSPQPAPAPPVAAQAATEPPKLPKPSESPTPERPKSKDVAPDAGGNMTDDELEKMFKNMATPGKKPSSAPTDDAPDKKSGKSDEAEHGKIPAGEPATAPKSQGATDKKAPALAAVAAAPNGGKKTASETPTGTDDEPADNRDEEPRLDLHDLSF
jgi:hypothetical protein